MTEVLELHRDPSAGFEILLPAGWERTERAPACALVAVEPPRAEPHLRASVVVTVERIGDEEPDAWAERSVAALSASMNELQVIDDEPVDVGGRPARRVLSHYVHRGFGGVSLEQWLVAGGGRGYVVSWSVAALEYDDLWDLGAAIGEGLRLT